MQSDKYMIITFILHVKLKMAYGCNLCTVLFVTSLVIYSVMKYITFNMFFNININIKDKYMNNMFTRISLCFIFMFRFFMLYDISSYCLISYWMAIQNKN